MRELFESKGITTAIINLGGNVVVMGDSPKTQKGWNVGVQDPDQVRGATVGSVPETHDSVVTSGIYERYIEVDGVKYHHILDPKTGYPVENDISGVTVFQKPRFKEMPCLQLFSCSVLKKDLHSSTKWMELKRSLLIRSTVFI